MAWTVGTFGTVGNDALDVGDRLVDPILQGFLLGSLENDALNVGDRLVDTLDYCERRCPCGFRPAGPHHAYPRMRRPEGAANQGMTVTKNCAWKAPRLPSIQYQ